MMASLPSNKRSRKYSKAKLNWGIDASRAETDSNNMLDPSTWVVGSAGDQPGFTSNHDAPSESTISSSYGPTGEVMPVWVCAPSGNLAGDGGWNATTELDCDHTVAYRFAFFTRRAASESSVPHRCGARSRLSDSSTSLLTLLGVVTTDPFFYSGSISPSDGWVLVIGHIFGSGYTGTATIGARYRLSDGVRLGAVGNDFKFSPTALKVWHRQLLYGVNDSTLRVHQTAPRMEPINGSEPPLATILAATATFTADYQEQIVTGSDGSENTMYVQTTKPGMAWGDYWIDYSSGENRVFYMDSSINAMVELEPYFLDSDPTAPSAIAITSRDPVYSSESNSGKRSVRHSGPQKYRATISYPPQTKREFAKVDAFLTYIRNTGDTFFLSLPNKRTDQFDNLAAFSVNGAGQSGYSLNVTAWSSDGYSVGKLKTGDFIKIEGSDKIYLLSEDVVIHDDATATLSLSQKLQFTPANGADITIVNPEMKCHLLSVHKYAVAPPELYSYEIDVEEVID